jgi:hypothetical protein
LFSRTKDRGRLKGAENNVTVTLALRIQVFSQTQVGASLEKLLSSCGQGVEQRNEVGLRGLGETAC